MSYGYRSSRSDSYKVTSEGVVVDLEHGLLHVTAARAYGARAHFEYPLILARVCIACGTPVAIYARGTLAAFEKETGHGHFLDPWEGRTGWHHLPTADAFALVAGGGHRFTESEYGLRALCHEDELRLVSFAQPEPAPPPRPPAKPRRPRPASTPAPTDTAAPATAPPASLEALTPTQEALPPAAPLAPATATASTLTPEFPPRTQLTFAW